MITRRGGVDVHAHVVPHDFLAYLPQLDLMGWPSRAPAQACHRHVMIDGKTYPTDIGLADASVITGTLLKDHPSTSTATRPTPPPASSPRRSASACRIDRRSWPSSAATATTTPASSRMHQNAPTNGLNHAAFMMPSLEGVMRA